MSKHNDKRDNGRGNGVNLNKIKFTIFTIDQKVDYSLADSRNELDMSA